MTIGSNFLRFPLFEGDNGGEGGGGSAPEIITEPIVSTSTSFIDTVPEEYRSREYTTSISQAENPQDALWKHLDGLETAMATRPGGIPADDAPDEAWAAWAQLIAPSDISAYGDLKPVLSEEQAHLKEVIDASYQPELLSKVLEAARSEGVLPRQFKSIINVFNNAQLEMANNFLQEQERQVAQLNHDFDKQFAIEFGNDKDKVIAEGKNFLKDNVSANMKQHVDALSNEALMLVAGLAYNAKQKYGREDTIPQGGSASNLANDEITLKAEIQKAMCDPDYENPLSPRHQQAFDNVRNLSERLSKITQPNRGYSGGY